MVLVALHSFKPVMGGCQRPWAAGVLHHRGRTDVALAMLAALHIHDDIVVGDNELYPMNQIDYTIPRHAYLGLLSYVKLELRLGLIGDAAGQRRRCAILVDALPARPTRIDR